MRGLGIACMWLLLGAVTFFVVLVHSGCGSAAKPSTAKPEPLTVGADFECLMVERKGQQDAIFCGSATMCAHAHERVTQYWDVMQTRYGATALSDCVSVSAQFTAKE